MYAPLDALGKSINQIIRQYKVVFHRLQRQSVSAVFHKVCLVLYGYALSRDAWVCKYNSVSMAVDTNDWRIMQVLERDE